MSEQDKPAPPPARGDPPAPAVEDEDSDPGYEDLDDILDQFNPSSSTKPATQNAPTTAPAEPSASGPGRPAEPTSQSEADFMAELQAEMAKAMTGLGVASGDEAKEEAKEIADMSKELDEFTAKMEKEGIQPEDLLKAILGGEDIDMSKLGPALGELNEASASTSSAKPGQESKDSFEETIRKTMERMQASDSSATNAAQTAANSEEDMLAQLVKAMEAAESGGGGGGSNEEDGDLSNLFLNMMHQLTSKDLLYEPMKELNDKFPGYLEKNKDTIKAQDLERYQTQQVIVKEIVGKFEEKTYSDDNQADRAFVWEKMQKMQAAGSPPEDLIEAPFPGAFGPGTGEQGLGAMEGCPTQ